MIYLVQDAKRNTFEQLKGDRVETMDKKKNHIGFPDGGPPPLHKVERPKEWPDPPNPPTVTSVNQLLGYHQILFSPHKEGVWCLNCIFNKDGGSTNTTAYCSEDIVRQWVGLHFSVDDLKALIEKMD